MNQQLMLFSLFVAFLLLFLQSGGTAGNAMSYALAGTFQRFSPADLYQRVQIVFEEGIEDIKKEFKNGVDKLKGDFNAKQKELEDAIKGKASADDIEKLNTEQKGIVDKIVERVDELEAQTGRLKQDKETQYKSQIQLIGETLTKKDAKGKTIIDQFKATRNVEFEVKAVSTMNTAYAITSGARIPVWDREPGVAKAPDRSPFILDLITIGATSSNTVEWVERTLREGYAGQTAEGGTPPLMSMIYNTFSERVKKTTVMLRATTEMLEDVEFLQGEIQTEGLDAMELVIDSQIYNGAGTGENLKGILTYASAFAKPAGLPTVTAANEIDVLNAATTQIQNGLFIPSAYIMHPTDLLAIKNRKQTDNHYLEYPGFDPDNNRLNGLPIITNIGVTQGNYLVGDFSKSKYTRRKGITIAMFDQNGTDAETGHIMIRCEARGVHHIKGAHTPAFVKGTFAAGITALSA